MPRLSSRQCVSRDPEGFLLLVLIVFVLLPVIAA